MVLLKVASHLLVKCSDMLQNWKLSKAEWGQSFKQQFALLWFSKILFTYVNCNLGLTKRVFYLNILTIGKNIQLCACHLDIVKHFVTYLNESRNNTDTCNLWSILKHLTWYWECLLKPNSKLYAGICASYIPFRNCVQCYVGWYMRGNFLSTFFLIGPFTASFWILFLFLIHWNNW